MEAHTSVPYLREIIIFLIAAGVMVPLFHRVRVSPVLGYLVVGGVIGPFGPGLWAANFPILSYATITDLESTRALAELGVVFLLFTIGSSCRSSGCGLCGGWCSVSGVSRSSSPARSLD